MSAQAFKCPNCGHMNVGNIRCYNCHDPLNTVQAKADQSEVIFTSFGRPVLTTLFIDMQLVIQKHQGRTSLSEVLGVLELVKHGLIEGHK